MLTKVFAMGDVKMVGFRAPVALLDKFHGTLKKRGANKRGGQQEALVEAVKLWISLERGDIVKVYVDNNPATLMDLKDITVSQVLSHDLRVSPVLTGEFTKGQLTYLAKLLLEIAHKHGGDIHLVAKEDNVHYLVPADLEKLNVPTLVENVNLLSGTGPHLYIGERIISLTAQGFG
jgi:hypothetical protein